MIYFKRIASYIGIDKSIAYSSLARVIQGGAGVISIFFISTFLSGVEQGFYYTFASVVALQVFFELGLTGIMTQYVAHEAVSLVLLDNGEYKGEAKYKSRLSSLLRFCTLWYAIIAVIVFLFLLVFGYFYFSKYGNTAECNTEWRFPWILICIGTSIKLFQSPFTSIFNGLGKVKEMSRIIFYQQIIIPLSTWLGLVVGLKLYIVGISYLLSVIIWLYFVYKDQLISILVKLWNVQITEKVSYLKEIFPFQWKIALSWMSGYFIFQLFNPVLFATEGAVVAGRMGMTLQALNAISAFSMSWLNTKIPLYSKLIALKDYTELDSIFNKTLKQMSTICACLLLCFFLFILLLKKNVILSAWDGLSDRFLDLIPLLLMIIPVFLQQYTNSWATYLRCHKKEPFLGISITTSILCLCSTFGLGNAYGVYGITIGYCIIQSLVFSWSHWLFKKKQLEWHN